MRSTVAVLALSLFAFPALAAVTGTVMTTDGAPISGARVSLFAQETTDVRRARLVSQTPEAVPLASTQTDSKGNFSFDSPKEATVALRVYAKGYEPRQQTIEREADTGAIALTKTTMRTGTITANGKPVANALVSIVYDGYEYDVRTNDAGRYEAPDFKRAAGVTVIHPDYAIAAEPLMSGNRSLDRVLTPGVSITGRTTTSDGKTPIAKATVSVDTWPLTMSGDDGTFTVAHAPVKWGQLLARKDSLIGERAYSAEKAQTVRMTKGSTVSGRALDAKTKLPIAGVMVGLGQRRMFIADARTLAITDAKGAYSMIVPAGAYMLWPSHPSFEANPIDLNVSAGQPVSRDFTLDPLARVSGVVVDEEKKPVAAASVIQEESRDAMFRGGPIRFMREFAATTGPDGRFSMRIRGENEFRLRATKKGNPAASSDPLKLTAGDRKSGVVIVVPNGVAVTGRVTDRENNPLSGIAITPSETQTGGRGGMQRMIFMGLPQDQEDAVTTASDGTFTLRLKEGTYDFAFKGDGYAPKSVRAQAVTERGPNVVEASLDPAVAITGRITRGGTGVEGVRIFGMMGGGEPVTSGPDGSFTIDNLAPGPMRLMMRKEADFIEETRTVDAPARDVNIEVPAGSRISGHVREKDSHKPVTSFQAGISTSRSGGGMIMMSPPMLQNFTSDDGSFVLDHVPPGAKTVIASAPGFASARTSVNVEENKSIDDVTLELDTGVKLTGKVTGPNGSPLPDVSVRLAPSSTGSFASGGDRRTMTDENGEYTLEALEPGEEAVEFSHPKHLNTRKEVTLKGHETRLDVQMSAGQRVTGVVVTEAGAAVPDAEVEAMAAGGSMRSTRSDANGTFTFDSLSPARYQFTASKNGFADGQLEDFDVAGGAQPRIVMRTGGVIYGHVSGLTEQELTSTNVDARSGSSSSSAPVDASGNYRLEGAPVGTVSVVATVMSRDFARRKTSRATTVELAAGGTAQADIEFRTDTTVHGRVTRNGQALSGGSVTFISTAGRSQGYASVPTDESGSYTVTGLEEGEYTVSVVDVQRLSSYSTTYRVSGSGTFDIEYSAGAVRGRVVDSSSNEGLSNVNVQLRASTTTSESFRGTRAVISDAGGTFTFDSVPAGSYVVNASKDGFGNQAVDLTIGDSGKDDVELRLARNDGVSLRVVDGRDGRTLRAMVWVFDTGGRMVYEAPMMFGGADDATEIKLPLAAGDFTATVMSMGYAARSLSFHSPSSQTMALTPGGTIAIRSKHSGSARVRLIDATGQIYPRITIRPPTSTLNPSPGITTIENVNPGQYTLQLLGDNDVVIDSQQVNVIEGTVTSAEI